MARDSRVRYAAWGAGFQIFRDLAGKILRLPLALHIVIKFIHPSKPGEVFSKFPYIILFRKGSLTLIW